MNLPAPLQAYFAANAALDLEGMVAAFAAMAVVHDEHQVHEGTDAIRAWIAQATIAASAIAVPQAIVSDAHTHDVTTEVSGAFPGSPITLTQRFVLNGDHIARLEIG
jgi:hypothetical protein